MEGEMKAIDTLASTLGLDPGHGLTTISGSELAAAYFPPLNPDLGALVLELDSSTTERILKVLRAQYPREHRVVLLLEMEAAPLERSLHELESDFTALALYLPPLDRLSSVESLQSTVAHLRAPEGCPWDREQTHQSLRKHLLEEAYETLEAIDRENLEELREELGDLLLQILMQAQIAQEAGIFNMSDVVSGIQAKLIRRHPHVFGDVEVTDVDQVLNNWEHYKSEEKDGGPLEGVPGSLPALAQSAELQDRAGRVGFQWPGAELALEEIKDKLTQLVAEGDQQLQPEEVGDLLFAIVNYARRIKVDAEAELQRANQQFRIQFSNLLQAVAERGQQLEDLEIADLIHLWNGTGDESA
jgi:tetrapyrrole methylase family protein/MazG family protein